MNNQLSSALVFLCILLSYFGQAQIVDRGPYLQSAYQTHITIKWETDDPTSSKIWYGSSPSDLSMSMESLLPTEEHEFLLSDLIPNTIYYYAVGNAIGQLAGADSSHFFKTNPLENSQEQVRVWILGDPGFGNNNQRGVRDGFYQYNQDEELDLILSLGDNAYSEGKNTQYQDAWFENMYEDKLINTPLFLTYGNHDAESADGEDGTGPYFDIFNFPTNGECGGQPSGNESYYSHDFSNIHFISLNSWDVEHSPESPMIQWLEDDLASNDLDWTVVMFHHPIYDGQRDNISDWRTRNTGLREVLAPLFDQYAVDLVLMGHSHTYQRSFLIDGHYGTSNTFDPVTMGIDMGDGQIDGDGAYTKIDGKGIPYVVCGTSGYSQTNEDLNHAVMYHNELSKGSVYLELNYDQLDYKYINDEGYVADYFTIQKGLEYTVYDCPDQTTNFGVNCDDNNTFTYQDTIDHNCNCVGIPYDCPAFFADFGTACDDNNPNTYIDVLTTNCECAGTPMFNPGNISIKINNANDDAEEYSDGTVKLASSDLELVEDNSRQVVGLRFPDVSIPVGATPIEAYIQFTTDQTDDENTILQIYGEANSSSPSFEAIAQNISNRTKTNSKIDWTVGEWAAVGNAGLAERSPNILPIITELMLAADYTSNNAMTFIIEGNGKRVAGAYDGNPEAAAQLIIKYAYDCIDVDQDGICDEIDSCPETFGIIGSNCDDGNPATYGDVLNGDCNCVGSNFDCPTLLSNIGSTCDDGNPETVNDVIQVDCQCLGVPPTYDCPTFSANVGDSCNDNNALTVNDVINIDCVCAGIIAANNTLTTSIKNSSDDAEQQLNGNVNLTSSDLEMVIDNGTSQVIGLRFDEVGLPPDAEVTGAYIQFTGDQSTYTDPCELTIHGELSNSSTTFLAQSENISSRIRTASFSTWIPTSIWAVDESTTAQRTENLKDIVAEVIALDGYESNNAITFFISGYGNRVASSFDKSEDTAPILIINYNFICVDPDNDGICGSEDPCPNLVGIIGSPCDDNNPITINDVLDENCNCLGTEPLGFACSQISSPNGDAEERVDGRVKLFSSDLELTRDVNDQTIGLTFTELYIPPAISITNAQIQFTVDENKNEAGELFIYGELSTNPLSFAAEDYDLSSRTFTNNFITWSPNTWSAVDESGPDQQTVDLSPIIQEIVNQENYDPNNPIVLLIQGDGKRVAKAFDGNEPEDAAQLCVDYDISALNSANPYEETEDSNVFSSTVNNRLTIFPNPAKNNISLSFDQLESEEKVDIRILDGRGSMFLKKELEMSYGQHNLQFGVSHLPNGIYYVQLTRGELISSSKFVVLR